MYRVLVCIIIKRLSNYLTSNGVGKELPWRAISLTPIGKSFNLDDKQVQSPALEPVLIAHLTSCPVCANTCTFGLNGGYT